MRIAAVAATTATFFMFFATAAVRGFSFSTVARRTGWISSGLKMRSSDKSLVNAICTPKTQNQKLYNSYLKDERANVIICTGPAGSGKTALACHYAIEKYKQGLFKKIVITRPLVTVEEDIGFLPGTLNKKMEPWTRPMMDIFNEYYPISVLNNMIKEGIIEISPLAFMRGRTFKHSIIIADEMQNSSPNQMLMVTTRIGEGSKLIITGDLKQTDTAESGLKDLLYRYRAFSGSVANLTTHMKLVEMGNEDIVRHHVVSKILDLYNAVGGGGSGSTKEAVAAPAPQPEYKMSVKEAIDYAFQNGGVVSTADLSQQNSDFSPIPDFSGETADDSNDCALIPQKDMDRIMRGLERRAGTTDCLFDDTCFIDSGNITYNNRNSTEFRKK